MEPMPLEERMAALELNLSSVTDQIGGLLDKVLKKGFIPAFRCAHSGLLLPVDYIKQWGKLYGIGLGPAPVSEVLDSDYDTSPDVPKSRSLRTASQIMHPIGPCMSQVDFDLFEPDAWAIEQAILDKDDPGMHERAAIVRTRQLVNPRSKLRLFQAALEA